MTYKARALILGCGGQDGSYCVELLLEKGYEVYGLYPYGGSLANLDAVKDSPSLHLIKGDITDLFSLRSAMNQSCPDEVYNYADMDDVGWSFQLPEASFRVTAGGVLNVLESARTYRKEHSGDPIAIFQPLSALMFHSVSEVPQTEKSILSPRSPYAAAKAAAWTYCSFYREHYGMRVTCGIFYNHTSPRQGSGYLLGKIAKGVADITRKKEKTLALGSLSQVIDIGHARDYVEMAYLATHHTKADDFIIASGARALPTIYDLVRVALHVVGLPGSVHDYVILDSSMGRGRPGELKGDMTKFRESVGSPISRPVEQLVTEVVSSYMEKETR